MNQAHAALEIGGRLQSGPADTLVNSAFASELRHQIGLLPAMGLVDLAYTLTGINTGVIPVPEGSELLSGLLALQAQPDSFIPASEAGDLYTNREAWLQRYTDAAGWLGAGRARREATTSAFLILQRRQLLTLLSALAALGHNVTQRADEYKQGLMPDYTYLQAAQPTTFGHYLTGFLYPILRDCERIEQLYRRINASPMGCGSTTGSRLAIDRRQMADLLGFDTLVVHTRDAMWQPDLPIETAAIFCTCAVNMSRLAEDLQIFSSREFGLVELSEQHSRASKIMPQKKNPFALTHIRGVCNELLGLLTAVNAMARTPSGQPDNRLWIYGAVPDAASSLISTVYLLTDVIRNIDFRFERGKQLLEDASTLATDLAEALVLHAEIDYRSAYKLVAKLVYEYQEQGGIKALNAAIINQAAQSLLGREVSLSDSEINRALDPCQSIESRTEPGTAANISMRAMLDDCARTLQRISKQASEGTERLLQIEQRLLAAARQQGRG